MEDKWYLITWQDDSPYKVVSRFYEEGNPDSMIVILEDPYGKVSMCQMTKIAPERATMELISTMMGSRGER